MFTCTNCAQEFPAPAKNYRGKDSCPDCGKPTPTSDEPMGEETDGPIAMSETPAVDLTAPPESSTLPENEEVAGTQEGDKVNDVCEDCQAGCEAPQTEFREGCQEMRAHIGLVKSKVKNWMDHPAITDVDRSHTPLNRRDEMEANLVLAYRHLEDARMRIGKAIQANDGGKSCYPK